MDIVLVPTFARPEYLTLCLEHLAAAQGSKDKHIHICHDHHHTDHVLTTRDRDASLVTASKFQDAFASFKIEVRAAHKYVGNPCNFLELYKMAYQTEARYVYLVEDDVMVAPDFFKWHEAVQTCGTYFCSVAWNCIRNPEVDKSLDPTAYIETAMDFSSIGVCWRRENLAPLVKHATKEYYEHMGAYLEKAFPGSPVPRGQWTEQAGVVTRLLHESPGRFVAWPAMPRCAHVGIQGYHRPQGHRFLGTVAQRVKALRDTMASTATLAKLAKDPYNDVAALRSVPAWRPEDLHVTQRFEYVKGRI